MGSIPIARSITHDDSIGLAHLNCRNLAEKWPFLDPKWTPVESIGPWCFAEKTGQSGGLTNLTGPSFAPSIPNVFAGFSGQQVPDVPKGTS